MLKGNSETRTRLLVEDEEPNALVRGVRRVVQGTRRRAGTFGERVLDRVRGASEGALADAVRDQLDAWLVSPTEPENAVRLQSTLARITQLGMEMGFRADPDAARLYELVAWLEERHGREPVMRRVAEHAVAVESEFLSVVEALADGYWRAPGSPEREEAAGRMHAVRDQAQAHLLDLLCSLASLEADRPPPEGVDAQVDYFEAAPLPAEFGPLAAMAAGRPGAFAAAERRERRPSLLERLAGRAHKQLATEATPRDASRRAGLTRFVPSFDDPHLRFLTLTHLFFLQSYLTRNLVEALPDLLEQAGRMDAEVKRREQDVIDVE